VEHYYHVDHLGTSQRLTNTQGETTWRMVSEAFGKTLVDTILAPATTGTTTNNLRFPGQYEDPETGTYYNYFRDYDPAIGRYIQSDPIGLKGGLNTYLYVDGMPLTLSDPKGLFFGFDCYECYQKLKIYNKILSDCRKLYDRYCYNQDGSRDEQRTNNFLQLYGGGSDGAAVFNCARQGALSALGTNVLGDISSCQKCAWGPTPGRKLPPK
jgi:RHS repeat-associated protein